ncbi:hypothetical protein [Caldilinea aerophila]|jgi:hypothetical protein|uniref:Uncharacterized protein n=1 Tax=Caldilinea aerophila (strain DSM 14535 / JCM 11387 / NBRC 104270 / STL-6-O1) TaxID=926550 RepID=I0I2G5_CALAS|nr:hypothetical protein [Caldilinea aerophila]BAL99452.1 hypothetical protein CLDAP_14130 [Caldilinea aerophila DSM 14535 = NBRC 104270]
MIRSGYHVHHQAPLHLRLQQKCIEALKAIAPKAFADGKINWETPRKALGKRMEDEGCDAKHFDLFWLGKRQTRWLTSTCSCGTLIPAAGEG